MPELRNMSGGVGNATHIAAVDLSLEHGSLNVLLGPTLSGRTTLMRMMAGPEKPTSGRRWFEGRRGEYGPVLNAEESFEYWVEQGEINGTLAPQPEKENEDEHPVTISYSELIQSWNVE
jgi:ABC-type multidrug transport system ATPase subunit